MGLLGNVAKYAASKAIDAAVATETLMQSQPAAMQNLFHPNKLAVTKRGVFSTRDLEIIDQSMNERYKVHLQEKGATHATVYDSSGNSLVELSCETFRTSGLFGLSTSSKRYVLRQRGGFLKVTTLGRVTPDYSQPTMTKLDFDFNGWQIRGSFMSNTYEVLNQQGVLVAQIVSVLEERKPYVIGYANLEDELGVVICLAVLDLHLHTE